MKTKTSQPVAIVAPPDLEADRLMAAKIRKAYSEASQQFKVGVVKLIAAGALMLEQKQTVKHGEFGPWLKEFCFPGIDDREFKAAWLRANRWMESATVVMEQLQIPHVRNLAEVLTTPALDLDEELQKLQRQVFDFIEGKSQRQLRGAPVLQIGWKSELDAREGGDKEWEAWLAKHHPELIVDDKVPGRKEVAKEIQKEFKAYEAEQAKKLQSPEFRLKVALENARAAEEIIYAKVVRNSYLKLLPPAELTALHVALKQAKERVEKLLK